MKRWLVKSRDIMEIVPAADQWEAWDTLKDRPIEDFGLVVLAEPDESGDPIPVQTVTLMERWGRRADAEAFRALAFRALGLRRDGEQAP